MTIALITAMHVRHLVRRAAIGATALRVLSAALLVVPLMLHVRVRCTDDGQDLDALIGSGYVLDLRIPALGLGPLAVVGCSRCWPGWVSGRSCWSR